MAKRRTLILGVLLGAAFGLWNLIETLADPLADDSPSALLAFYGPMFAAWGLAGTLAARRDGRVADGVKAAAGLALVSFSVYTLLVMLRINLFLDAMRRR